MTNISTDHPVKAGKDAAGSGAGATAPGGSGVAEATALAEETIVLLYKD